MMLSFSVHGDPSHLRPSLTYGSHLYWFLYIAASIESGCSGVGAGGGSTNVCGMLSVVRAMCRRDASNSRSGRRTCCELSYSTPDEKSGRRESGSAGLDLPGRCDSVKSYSWRTCCQRAWRRERSWGLQKNSKFLWSVRISKEWYAPSRSCHHSSKACLIASILRSTVW